MSLNQNERARTAVELREALERSGVGVAEIATQLGWSAASVHAVLDLDGAASPVQVWAVRDCLDDALHARGEQPGWSVLTDANRRRAMQWFDLPDRPAAR